LYLTTKFRNVLRGMLQKAGSARVKKNLWDKEFANGRWDYLDNTPEDCVYGFIEKYGRGGSILDLGCGSGNSGNELAANAYQEYTGVDVSEVAVEKARARSQGNGRMQKNRYFQSDIVAYAPTQSYDVILFRESIFYVPRVKIKEMLDEYAKHLKPGGVFIVRMCDRQKYHAIVQLIKDHYQIVEEYLPEKVTTIIQVFR